jgi:uncharacterized peroxidase-related enzyme
MSRIAIPARDEVPAASQAILDTINRQLGFTPNLSRLLSLSPAALAGVTRLQNALSQTLDEKTQIRIALVVSQVNGCNYCLSAHSYFGAKVHQLSHEEIALNRQGRSSDPKANAVVRFAKKVTETRGKVSDADLSAIRAAGYGDQQIIEIVSLVVQCLFTNFINNVADTDLDYLFG